MCQIGFTRAVAVDNAPDTASIQGEGGENGPTPTLLANHRPPLKYTRPQRVSWSTIHVYSLQAC